MVEIDGNFDIEKFAEKLLLEIKDIRSFDKENSVGTSNPNESRLNSFFRMVGIPMLLNIKGSNKIVTPGFNTNLSDLELKNGDFSSLFSGEELNTAIERESKLLERDNNINSEQTLDDMKNSLSIPIPLSPIVTASEVSSYRNSHLTYKKLFPIITYYNEVSPSDHILARPFATGVNAKINEMVLKKPFIETVIKIRFLLAGSQDPKKYVDFLTFMKTKIDSNLYAQLEKMINVTSTYNVLEQFIVGRVFSSLSQIAKSWVAILKTQNSLSSQFGEFDIIMKTNSSINDVFGRRVSSEAVSTTEGTRYYNTQKMYEEKIATEEGYVLLLSPTDEDNNSSSNSLESLFKDLVHSELQNLKSQQDGLRQKLLKISSKVENLRVKLDTLTGEFLGISLIDVIAIITALFLIEKEDLVALIDKDVRNVMKQSAPFNSGEFATMDASISGDEIGAAKKALENLQKQVSFIFAYLNILISDNNNRSPNSAS